VLRRRWCPRWSLGHSRHGARLTGGGLPWRTAQQSRWGWGWRGYFLVTLAGEEMVCTALITFKMEGIGMVGRHASG
jgi:hypothetical protein